MANRFKKGDIVYAKSKGHGVVTMDTYNTMNCGFFGTKTSVLWDDYLGQKFPLAEVTEDLELVHRGM
jgi:hypothetical protein